MPFSSASKRSVWRRFQNAVVCVRTEIGVTEVVNCRWWAYSWMAVYIISLSFLKFLLWMMISRVSGLYRPWTFLLFFPDMITVKSCSLFRSERRAFLIWSLLNGVSPLPGHDCNGHGSRLTKINTHPAQPEPIMVSYVDRRRMRMRSRSPFIARCSRRHPGRRPDPRVVLRQGRENQRHRLLRRRVGRPDHESPGPGRGHEEPRHHPVLLP